MVKSRKQKASPKDQISDFRKAARELGCDESEERFQETLRTIAKQKPRDRPPRGKGD